MFSGFNSSINRLNKEEFLRSVSEWIEDQADDEADQAFKDYLRGLYFAF